MASICCSPPERVPPRWLRAFFQDGEQRKGARQIGVEELGIADSGAHLQVFLHGHARENAAPLRRLRNAEANNLMDRHVGDVMAIEGDGSGAGARCAANGHHQGRFSGAIRTDEGGDLALLHIEVDAPQGLNFAVEGFDAANREEGLAHLRTPFFRVGDFFAAIFWPAGFLATAATARSTTTSASSSSSTPR